MEIVGTVAAGLQVIDCCTRLSFGLYKLKNAPAAIQRNADSIHRLQIIVQSLQTDFQAPIPCPIRGNLSDVALSLLTELLQNCEREITALNLILRKKSFAIFKRGIIQDHLKQLQELERQLGLWYNHQLLSAISKHL